MKTLGYYNGKFGELDEMSIPMNDRVCWFGDGVYDAGLSRNYKIFALNEHIDRLFNSAGLLDIKVPVTKAELADLLQEMVNKMDTGNLFVYYQVTRGTGMRNHVFPEGKANLWIMLKPAEIADGTKPIKLITAEDTRFFHCNIKTLNLIPSLDTPAVSCRHASFILFFSLLYRILSRYTIKISLCQTSPIMIYLNPERGFTRRS